MAKETILKDITELLENLKILNVCIKKLDFENKDDEGLNKDLILRISLNPGTPNFTQDKNNFLKIIQPVKFEMHKQSNEKEDNESLFFILNVIYEVTYKLNKKINKQLFDEYSKNYLPKILHPYIRELIASQMTKAGLPPIQIPLFENV